MDEYYMQESLSCGENMLFWKTGKSGYTQNVGQAHVFSKNEAFRQNRVRSSDKPWPKDFIDSLISGTVNTHEALSKSRPLYNRTVDTCESLHEGQIGQAVRTLKNCSNCGRFFNSSTSLQQECTPCLMR